jgi:hypothetical protein
MQKTENIEKRWMNCKSKACKMRLKDSKREMDRTLWVLKVKLLRPYLNERARILVARLDVTKANDFDHVKTFLLHEFQLSPKVYLERFNPLSISVDETCLTFASNLEGLFFSTCQAVKPNSLTSCLTFGI